MNLRLPAAAAVVLPFLLYAAPSHAQANTNNTTVCAQVGDPEDFCNWDGPSGTRGRKCTLDVEKMPQTPCQYGNPSLPAISGHKPMCFSVQNAEHIDFQSGQQRNFRVRRLVPITPKNARGQACPRDPFGTTFDPANMDFGGSFDSQEAKSSAVGCQYKMEVQFQTEDPNAPAEPNDPNHRHFECRDPHLKIVN